MSFATNRSASITPRKAGLQSTGIVGRAAIMAIFAVYRTLRSDSSNRFVHATHEAPDATSLAHSGQERGLALLA